MNGDGAVEVRPATEADRLPLPLLHAAVAEERDGMSVFPHNEAGLALYRKFGFVEEGRHPKQIRRANGELWDLVDMGLLL